jgi:hypothetical protein
LESELKLSQHAKTKLFLIRSGNPAVLGCSFAKRRLFTHPFAEIRFLRFPDLTAVGTIAHNMIAESQQSPQSPGGNRYGGCDRKTNTARCNSVDSGILVLAKDEGQTAGRQENRRGVFITSAH